MLRKRLLVHIWEPSRLSFSDVCFCRLPLLMRPTLKCSPHPRIVSFRRRLLLCIRIIAYASLSSLSIHFVYSFTDCLLVSIVFTISMIISLIELQCISIVVLVCGRDVSYARSVLPALLIWLESGKFFRIPIRVSPSHRVPSQAQTLSDSFHTHSYAT